MSGASLEDVDAAEIAQHVAECIAHGTNHQIRQLRVSPVDGRLCITGTVRSFYAKQQALQATLTALGTRMSLAEFLVDVAGEDSRL